MESIKFETVLTVNHTNTTKKSNPIEKDIYCKIKKANHKTIPDSTQKVFRDQVQV